MNWLEKRITAPWTRSEGNPLFAIRSRRLGWPRTSQDFRRYGLLLLVAACAFYVIWVLATKEPGAENLFFLLLLLNAALTLGADLFYMLSTISSIHRQMQTGQWDELRLTHLSPEKLQQAEHALAEIHGWRLVMLQMVCRGLLVLSTIFTYLAYVSNLRNRPLTPVAIPGILIFAIVTAPLWLLFCVYEPIIGMEAVTHRAVTVAVRFTRESEAILSGAITLFMLRIGELTLLAAIFFVPLYILSMLSRPETLSLSCVFFVLIFPAGVIAIFLLNVYFRRVQRLGTRDELA